LTAPLAILYRSVKQYLRIYRQLDVDEIKAHLILVDDLYGICANCRHAGLNYTKDLRCPECGTEFRYLATRHRSETSKILARLEQDGRTITVIDRDDWEKATARNDLRGLFGS
jgi:hypothetical protein